MVSGLGTESDANLRPPNQLPPPGSPVPVTTAQRSALSALLEEMSALRTRVEEANAIWTSTDPATSSPLLTEMGELRRRVERANELWASDAFREPTPAEVENILQEFRTLPRQIAGDVGALLAEITVLSHRVDEANERWESDEASPLGPVVAQVAALGQRLEEADRRWGPDEASPLGPVLAGITSVGEQIDRALAQWSAELSPLGELIDQVETLSRDVEQATGMWWSTEGSPLGPFTAQLTSLREKVDQANAIWASTEASPLGPLLAGISEVGERVDQANRLLGSGRAGEGIEGIQGAATQILGQFEFLPERIAQSLGGMLTDVAALRERVDQANAMWAAPEASPLAPMATELASLPWRSRRAARCNSTARYCCRSASRRAAAHSA